MLIALASRGPNHATPCRPSVLCAKRFWDELFPAEQARIVRLLVERVDVAPDGIQVRLRAEGLQTLVEQLRAPDAKAHAA